MSTNRFLEACENKKQNRLSGGSINSGLDEDCNELITASVLKNNAGHKS